MLTVVKYEFDGRDEFIEAIINSLPDIKDLTERAKLFDRAIMCIDGSDVERHISMRLSFAKKLQSTINFALASKYYKEIIDIEEGNLEALWGIILCNLMAEYYSQELAQKIRRGLRESRKKGQFCGGPLPFGYLVKDKRVFIDEGKAEIIKFIFERYAIGESVPKIIQNLNTQGMLHNNKSFTPNCVYSILKNKKYIGVTQIDGEFFDIYPRIISDELFDKVKTRLDANRFGKNGVKEVYLLRNKVRCGYCGNTISAGCGTSHNRSRVRYYACRGRTKLKNGCTKSAVRKEILENLVLDNIYKSLSSEEECEKAISYLMQLQDELAKESQSVKLLEKEKRQTETALNNLMSAIEQGIVSNTTNKRLHELETKLEEIENHILKEKAKTTHTLTRSQMKEYYLKALKLEPQLLIDYLVEEIVLYDDKVVIKYKSPIKNGPDESRDFSLCENISKMRVVVQNKREPVYKEILIVKTI